MSQSAQAAGGAELRGGAHVASQAGGLTASLARQPISRTCAGDGHRAPDVGQMTPREYLKAGRSEADVGFFDTLFGRQKPTPAGDDKIFAMSTAQITLQVEQNLIPTGSAAMCFKGIASGPFSE